MKHKIVMVMLSVALIVSLVLTGCAEPAAPPEEPEAPPEEVVRLTMGGGTIGGMSNIKANAWAGVAKKFLGIDSTVITWPSRGHVDAIHDGVTDISGGMSDGAWEAYTATGTYAGQEPMTDLRWLSYDGLIQLQFFVLKGSPIRSYEDLVGKRLSAGKKGFQADYMFMCITDAIGLSYENDFDIVYMGHKEAGPALIAGKLDAYFATGMPPHPTFAEVDLMHPVTLVSLTKEEAEAVYAKYPFYLPMTLEPIYYHMDEPTIIISMPYGEITSPRLSEDIVYELVKNYMEHPEFVGYYHAMLQSLLEDGSIKKYTETLGGIPYHVGAYRYFKEIGWEISADRIPPEAK